MSLRQKLLHQISSLQAHVNTQQEKCNIATNCLAQTKAALAVSKVGAQVNGSSLTPKDIQEFDYALTNSMQGVTDAITSLAAMQRELSELKSALLMLPE